MTPDTLSYAGNFILGGGWLATFMFGGKREYQAKTVVLLQQLVEAQNKTIDRLTKELDEVKAQNLGQENRIAYLERELKRANSKLVHQGSLPELHRSGRQVSSADPAPGGER